jgi:hypothetical protein
MDLVEMETKGEFDAVHQILQGAEHLGWGSPYIYAGAQQNEAGKWKWISSGVVSNGIGISDYRFSDEQNEPCLLYSKTRDYLVIRSCKYKTTNVICEKVENQGTPIGHDSDNSKYKKLGTYGKKVKFQKKLFYSKI